MKTSFQIVTTSAVLVLSSALIGSVPAAAQDPVVTQEGITLNFQNVDLASVITALGQAAGINVASANMPDVSVTLRTAAPVPPEDVEALIRQLAAANGVSVTEEGGFLVLQGPILQDGVVQEPRGLYIYRLQHARAGILAATLSALFGGAIPTGNFGGLQGGQPLSQQLQLLEQQAIPGAGVAVGAQGQTFDFQLGGGELEGAVRIVPDEITNTLLVLARVNDWAIIEQAVQVLDLRPLQVIIEVVIAEVRTTDQLNLGVSFLATRVDNMTGAFTEALLPGEPPPGFSLSVFRVGNVNVNATLSALSSTGSVRILSRPIIQVQNNQEARILVGSERPFVQVSQVSDLGNVNEVVQYRDVGTSLTILPTINEDGYVNLFLTQEVSSATAEIQFGAPVISTREATTQLLARTGQTIVIGGLMEYQTDETRTGIPILKDIPLLGFLFGSTREVVTSSELFLFLTPFVVANDEDADRLRLEIEGNAELLEMLMPIRSLLPPALQVIVPDTIGG